jgi:hypothetical protein
MKRAKKRSLPLPRPPKPQPRRILAKPWEENPEEHLQNILDRLKAAAEARQYCNLSPADCELLTGSIKATVDMLDSATCVVRQVAREHYGEEGETPPWWAPRVCTVAW